MRYLTLLMTVAAALLQAAEPVSPPNRPVLVNGDMEQGIRSWKLYDSSGKLVEDKSRKIMSIEQKDVHGGHGALRLTARQDIYAVNSVDFPAGTLKALTVKAWFKGAEKQKYKFNMLFYNSENCLNAKRITDGRFSSCTGKWERAIWILPVPADANRVLIRISCVGTNSSPGELLCDDVKLLTLNPEVLPLQNSGLEQGLSGWNLWHVNQPVPPAFQQMMKLETKDVHTGHGALRLTDNFIDRNISLEKCILAETSSVNIPTGKFMTATVSAWVKGKPGRNLYLGLKFHMHYPEVQHMPDTNDGKTGENSDTDDDDTEESDVGSFELHNVGNFQFTGQWQKFSGTVKVPLETNKLSVVIGAFRKNKNDVPEEFLCDDITLSCDESGILLPRLRQFLFGDDNWLVFLTGDYTMEDE